jgi:preprotein translocase subunit YajC
MFFISSALAEGGAQQPGGWLSFLPMVAFIAILYFLLIRPQQKRSKQHQALIAAIKKGDKVITSCGIIASVSKVANDQEVVLEIADGVHCKFVKTAIASVIAGDGAHPAPANKQLQAGGSSAPVNRPTQPTQDANKKDAAVSGAAASVGKTTQPIQDADKNNAAVSKQTQSVPVSDKNNAATARSDNNRPAVAQEKVENPTKTTKPGGVAKRPGGKNTNNPKKNREE